MPIYEFKCLECEKYFEVLFTNKEQTVEAKCPECGAENFERVLSVTNCSIAPSPANATTSTTRTCSSGSCTTYNLPGHG